MDLGNHGMLYPIGSMYAIYANIWGIWMVNVTFYSIHGSYGLWVFQHDFQKTYVVHCDSTQQDHTPTSHIRSLNVPAIDASPQVPDSLHPVQRHGVN